MKRKQEPWMLKVKVGDVLQSRSGLMRIVRRVTRYEDGDLRCVTFSIKRCSWTHRPYTTVGYADLRMLGYTPVGVRLPVDSTRLERKLQEHIEDHNKRRLDCCAVKEVA